MLLRCSIAVVLLSLGASATACAEHPPVTLLDRDGKNVLDTGRPVSTMRMVTALTRAPCGLASRIPPAERPVVGGSAAPGARGGTVRGPSDPGEDHRAG